MAGTATQGTDYVALPGQAVIAAGAFTATIKVTSINDKLKEGSETIVPRLARSTGYTIGSPSEATVTIVDND